MDLMEQTLILVNPPFVIKHIPAECTSCVLYNKLTILERHILNRGANFTNIIQIGNRLPRGKVAANFPIFAHSQLFFIFPVAFRATRLPHLRIYPSMDWISPIDNIRLLISFLVIIEFLKHCIYYL